MQRAVALLLLGALCGAMALQGQSSSTAMLLDGLSWGISNGNGSISLRSSLPAYPVNLLQKEGIIQDPLYRFGEIETRWVALDTWTFAAVFTPTEELLARSSVDLVLDGVDTFASVYLNGELLAKLENFHRRYTLPAKQWLQSGANTLRITLHPAIPIAIERKKNHPYWIPTVTQLGNTDAYNFARKPAYDFGWDWGPGLAASGIFGGVSLLGYDSAVLRSAHVRQARQPNGDFLLRVEAQLHAPDAGDHGVLSAELPALNGLKATAQLKIAPSDAARGLITGPILEIAVPASSVKLWWPVGYGEQPLYRLVVKFTPNATLDAAADDAKVDGSSAAAAASPAPSVLERRVGFRTVELVEKPLSEAASELLSGAGGGWANSVKPGGGGRACAGMSNCGQYGWVDGKKWTFVSEALAAPNEVYPVSGYDFPGAYPNSSMPGGDNPWWNQKLGVWTGWGGPNLADRIEGESMYFKVNGVPIYAKGSNIIPFHTIPANATPELIASTVDLALDSRMNMLRVWGGGWYMPEQFYDLADEKGLLVWQETMFACASYPRDDKFMAEVKAEVEQQIRRIGGHPSVVIWGGNNEIETSLEWYRETQNNPALFVHDYTELFVAAIGGLMQELVPETPFVDSSPSNGVISRKPYIKRWGGAWDPRYGDVHHYDYNADCQNFKNYPMAKFVSEHGWPSFPTWPTFKAATADEDWAVGSPGMEFRQRHYNKTLEMTDQYMKHFRLPASWQGATKDESFAKWKQYLYMNHVQQAMCIDTAFSYWRRLRSEPKGLTMGILYWQLNDVWAGASWSGIDYEGRYKPMQYRVKHQFADFVVQTVLDNGRAHVFVVSDDMLPTTATLDISIFRLASPDGEACAAPAVTAGGAAAAPPTTAAVKVKGSAGRRLKGRGPPHAPFADPLPASGPTTAEEAPSLAAAAPDSPPAWARRITVGVPALNAAVVLNATVAEVLRSVPGCTESTCFLRVTATTEPTKFKPTQTSTSDLFFVNFKDLALVEPKITTSGFAQDAPDAVSFDLAAADAAALLVVAETDLKGRFDDNMVNLPPCGAARLTFKAEKGCNVTVAQLKASLTLAHLYGNQEPAETSRQPEADPEAIAIAAAVAAAMAPAPAASGAAAEAEAGEVLGPMVAAAAVKPAAKAAAKGPKAVAAAQDKPSLRRRSW